MSTLTPFINNFKTECLQTRIFISIDEDDSNSIQLLYEKATPESNILFEYASIVEESDASEIQFSLTVSPELYSWCQSMIDDEKDISGIFIDIISAVNEKELHILPDFNGLFLK